MSLYELGLSPPHLRLSKSRLRAHSQLATPSLCFEPTQVQFPAKPSSSTSPASNQPRPPELSPPTSNPIELRVEMDAERPGSPPASNPAADDIDNLSTSLKNMLDEPEKDTRDPATLNQEIGATPLGINSPASGPKASGYTTSKEAISNNKKTAILPSPSTNKNLVKHRPHSAHRHRGKFLLSPKVIQNLDVCGEPIPAIHEVLNHLNKVALQMSHLHGYIETEDAKVRPLYRWNKYNNYGRLQRATEGLEAAVRALRVQIESIEDQPVIPEQVTKRLYNRALNYSIATSNVASFAMAIMNHKTPTCYEEIEESSLSETEKDIAKNEISREVTKIIQHSTAATNPTYAALDLLLILFYPDPKDFVPKFEPGKKEASKSRHWTWKALAASVAVIGMIVYALHAYGPSTIDWEPRIAGRIESMRNRAWNLQTNLKDAPTAQRDDIELTNIMDYASVNDKMDNVGSRLQHLEEMSETHSGRIDNIWEALGPPNEDGTYYNDKTFQPNQLLEASLQENQKVMKHLVEQFNKDLAHLRKHIHRVDIRLMKELEKVKKGRA